MTEHDVPDDPGGSWVHKIPMWLGALALIGGIIAAAANTEAQVANDHDGLKTLWSKVEQLEQLGPDIAAIRQSVSDISQRDSHIEQLVDQMRAERHR